ncbi:hypothetical protein CW304_25585 [Bacillus sp. UFRGS-B20]|nr:hypothetical protein CW304_25585 [Bacillus sp. UFRGS-B20]
MCYGLHLKSEVSFPISAFPSPFFSKNEFAKRGAQLISIKGEKISYFIMLIRMVIFSIRHYRFSIAL